MMTGTTCFFPTYPTMPHIDLVYSFIVAVGGTAMFLRGDLRPPVARNPTHLVFEGETKLLNHRVGQDIARDALDLTLRLIFGKTAVERDFEVFTLAHVLQSLVAHLIQSALDGLALGVENTLL